MATVDISIEGNVSIPFRGVGESFVKRLARFALEILDFKKNDRVSIIFCDDKTIHKINKEYRKKNRPTDVISFAYNESPFPVAGKFRHVGDIYLSLERAQEQSIEYNHSIRDEIIRLIVHSICHLAGYDHEKSVKEDRRQRKKEDEIISEWMRVK